jgi:1-deoxy-D-xylulose 5-phosphate reductoisomerase
VEALIRQAAEYRPCIVACETPFDAGLLPAGTEAILGPGATEKLAAISDADVVVNGVSGFAASHRLPPRAGGQARCACK